MSTEKLKKTRTFRFTLTIYTIQNYTRNKTQFFYYTYHFSARKFTNCYRFFTLGGEQDHIPLVYFGYNLKFLRGSETL